MRLLPEAWFNVAAPFDDQAVIDLPESLTYANLAASSSTWSSCTLDDIGVQTVFAGTLSLVSRDVQVTVSRTAVATRPVEGGTITDGDGVIYTIVSVLKRRLGHFWEIMARTFSVPGGLFETGSLARRTNAADANGLMAGTWNDYLTDQPSRLIPDEQAVDTSGETAVDTMIRAGVVMAGFREIRAGDAYTHDDDTEWTVDSVDRYEIALGAQMFRVSRRV